MQNNTQNNLKQVLISILIGACVAFLSTLFDGLSTLLRQHAPEVVGGISTAMVYLAKAYRA